MFTGIIEETGRVVRIEPGAKSIRLVLEIHKTGAGLRVGDSLAVNGCCLTVAAIKRKARSVEFDLLRETWNKTNLQYAAAGAEVNIERPLRAAGRLDGHFVTGHVDGVGRIIEWEQHGADWKLEVQAPAEIMRYVVPKGSIAIDGISLTVATTRTKHFGIWIIPHTYSVTALHERKVGDWVNLEGDLLGKYVERFLKRKR